MESESLQRVEVRLAGDERFVRALEGLVGHIAARAGLEHKAQRDLVEATQAACRNSLALVGNHDATLHLVVEDLTDRIEVTLEHTGAAAPAAGLDSFAGGPADQTGLELLKQVDRVQYATEGGVSRLILTKLVRHRPPPV